MVGTRFRTSFPATYRVTVEMTGFKRATQDQVQVTVSGTVRADIVDATGRRDPDRRSQADRAAAADRKRQPESGGQNQAVEELPVNGRNLLNLTALVPGVVPQGTTSGNAITGKNIFAAGNYQIGGGLANQSATYYDGVPANSALGNLVNMVPSPDAISEFRVQTNSNSAEFGRYSGGVINISSKSGTNEFHGGAYEYLPQHRPERQPLLLQRDRSGKAAVPPEPVRPRRRRAHEEKQDLLLRRLGRLMPHAREPITWGPCRFRPCITEISRATRTLRAR